jgi:hypothetical protein
MTINNLKTIQVQLSGLRPLMFDRYAGDNSTTLPPEEKMYLTPAKILVLPVVNLFSLLCSENSKSVCRQFFGKAGKTIAMGIASYVMIDPFEVTICDGNDPIVFKGWDDKISVHNAVARVKGGIPNPKKRPVIALPWNIEFDVTYQDNKYCSLENLRQAFAMGGTLGLGTFRPFYGRYEVTMWQEKE